MNEKNGPPIDPSVTGGEKNDDSTIIEKESVDLTNKKIEDFLNGDTRELDIDKTMVSEVMNNIDKSKVADVVVLGKSKTKDGKSFLLIGGDKNGERFISSLDITDVPTVDLSLGDIVSIKEDDKNSDPLI